MRKYLLYIVCGSLVLVVSLGSFFYGNYNNKKIGKKNIEVSTLQNKVNATKQSDSLKVQAIISNENGLSQERLTKDKEILEKFMSDVFDWSSYKQYEEKRAKIMAQYNLKEDSTFMKVFMPKVVNENMNGKDYNRIDINGYNLKYQDMKAHVTKINTTEYSYFVEVNVVAKSENEGTAVGRTIFEATINADGNIKDIKATLVTGE